jgi:hypothetical protein
MPARAGGTEDEMVRAKFRCTEKTSRTSTGGYGPTPPQPVDTEEVKLQAVMGDENKEWSKWTPSGLLTMSITNPEALAQFEVGKDYFLDFTPVEVASS